MSKIKRYPWPCSKIDRDLMHELHCESKKNGEHITTIIAEAVSQYLNAKLDAVVHNPTPAMTPRSMSTSPLMATRAPQAA